MKNWFNFFLIILSISCTDRGDNTDLVVSGNVKYPSSGFIDLEILTPDGYEKVASAKLSGDNFFSLAVPKGKAEIYQVNFFGIQKNQIVLNSQDISIEADGNQTMGGFIARGSHANEILSNVYVTDTNRKLKENLFKQKFVNLNNKVDTVEMKALKKEFMEEEDKFHEYLKQSILSLDGDLAAWFILTEHFDIEKNLKFYEDQISLFHKTIPESWQLKLLNGRYLNVMKLALGAVAPDFSLPDPDGKLIQMSSFRGKYLFLDFWASWCQPCRMENPDLMKVYNKYTRKDFEILGVSFDKKKSHWLKAIELDGLEWVHVSDLKYFDSEMIKLYNIVNVPTTILLDPEGKIIAKNIHSDELESILSERL